jgi:hypothetical protein
MGALDANAAADGVPPIVAAAVLATGAAVGVGVAWTAACVGAVALPCLLLVDDFVGCDLLVDACADATVAIAQMTTTANAHPSQSRVRQDDIIAGSDTGGASTF